MIDSRAFILLAICFIVIICFIPSKSSKNTSIDTPGKLFKRWGKSIGENMMADPDLVFASMN